MLLSGVFIVVLASLLFMFGLIMLDETYDVLPIDTISTSDTFIILTGTNETLSQTSGVASLTATVKNRTWLEFDGVNDNIKVDNDLFSWVKTDSHFTYSAWVNVSTLDNAKAELFSIGGYFGVRTNLPAFTNGSINFYSRNASAEFINISSPNNINDSLWHLITVTSNKTGIGLNRTLYIDGALINTSNFTSYSASSVNGYIVGVTLNSWKGAVDEVRIYNRSLNGTAINEINSSGRFPNSSLTTDGLIIWASFNENSGTTIHGFNQSDF